jgi:hypothetical protein
MKKSLVKTTLTPAEKTRLESLPKPPPLPKISEAEKTKAQIYAHAATVFMAKALLHKSDPVKYPMDMPAGSMEKRSMDFVNTLSATQLQRATDKLKATLADDAQKTKVFGKYKTMDYTKASTTAQLEKASDAPHFSKYTPPNTHSAPPYTRIELDLNGIYCIEKTDAPPSEGWDQIIVGGLVGGLKNEVYPGSPLYAGNFGPGDYVSGTYYFGSANLHPEISFPKTFYAYFLVIEYDGVQIEQDVANMVTQLQNLANQLSGVGYAEAFFHNYVEAALENYGNMYFWDRYLNVTPIPVVLNDLNAFGSDKISDYLNSGDIYGWGGRYQIFYSWKMLKD